MEVLDVFSGCGGASLGFRDAGFRIVGGIDKNQMASMTFKKNIGSEAMVGDLNEKTPSEILKHFDVGDLDVLIGCPPCQGFTDLRIRKTIEMDDDRNMLVLRYVEFVRKSLPKSVVFENVSGIGKWNGGMYLNALLSELGKMGYAYICGVLNATDYGVPQIRKRLIVVASRMGQPSLPKAGWGEGDSKDVIQGNRKTWLTVGQTIGPLKTIEPGESDPGDPLHHSPLYGEKVLKIIRALPKDGGSRRDLPREMWLACHNRLSNGFSDVYGRMRWKAPAPTITGGCHSPSKGRFVHPFQDRGITLREAALLQGFPPDYAFVGGRMEVARQIGNALPPPLAMAIANSVKSLIT